MTAYDLQTPGWACCCDFHDKPEDIAAHLKRWGEQYGRQTDGTPIEPPEGWVIVQFRANVPSAHREFHARAGWLRARRGHSTMTPIFARPAGEILAYATPAGEGTL
ncbi:hypothetical protein [Ralstonia sp.]|uniref:hypothetical protein n=1 Tax=Ralstonia sp. TaxID=54061 RepID=UPI00257DBA27|nr:hypothetical protein [Ralstonia sp.]MBA4203213.1 hypothetical protein [Ralstonia sp.]